MTHMSQWVSVVRSLEFPTRLTGLEARATVILKTAEQTPLSANYVAQLSGFKMPGYGRELEEYSL